MLNIKTELSSQETIEQPPQAYVDWYLDQAARENEEQNEFWDCSRAMDRNDEGCKEAMEEHCRKWDEQTEEEDEYRTHHEAYCPWTSRFARRPEATLIAWLDKGWISKAEFDQSMPRADIWEKTKVHFDYEVKEFWRKRAKSPALFAENDKRQRENTIEGECVFPAKWTEFL